jgi:hypothetical protein
MAASLSTVFIFSLFLALSAALRIWSSLALVRTLFLTLATLFDTLSVNERYLLAPLPLPRSDVDSDILGPCHTARLPHRAHSLSKMVRYGFSRRQKIREFTEPMDVRHTIRLIQTKSIGWMAGVMVAVVQSIIDKWDQSLENVDQKVDKHEMQLVMNPSLLTREVALSWRW